MSTRPFTTPTKLFGAIFILLLAAVAVGTIRMAFYSDDQKEQKQVAQADAAQEKTEKRDLATQVKEACDKGGEGAKALTAQGACGKAKDIIKEPVDPPPATNTKTVTEGQVRTIVAAEVARRNLTLTTDQVNTIATVAAAKVPKPKDGKAPTNAELQPLASAAVATFCANDACRGKDGATPPPGKDAPPLTDERLAQILDAYCGQPGRNGCIGKDGADSTVPGPAGGQGEKGADGNGIKSTTIVGETITFTYTDGTKDTVVVPLCSEGSTPQKQRLMTEEFPLGLWVSVCVLTDQNP